MVRTVGSEGTVRWRQGTRGSAHRGGGGETRVAGCGWGGNARAEGGSGTASDEGRPTVRDGAHHITMWSWTFACGRARRRGVRGGRVRVGLAERGGAKPPRNEQRTTDAFEGAVARSRRGARASHRHVRELSRGDDEFRWDGGVRRRHRGVRTVAHTDPERCPRHRLSSHRLPPPRAPGRTSSRVARESLERPARRRVD